MEIWNVLNVLITGDPDTSQTIKYGDLTDINGHTLPSLFTKPSIAVAAVKQDRQAYIVGDVGTESFQIAKAGSGVSGDVYVHLTIYENADPWTETA